MVIKSINIKMRYKISYNKKWNNEGTTYSQTLNVTLTRKEFTDKQNRNTIVKINSTKCFKIIKSKSS